MRESHRFKIGIYMYYVYILCNKKNGVLYTGYTDNIKRRIFEHKNKRFKGFTNKYNVDKLVYFETMFTEEEAKLREKRIKKWNRDWKINLIEKDNPDWADLSGQFRNNVNHLEEMEILFGKKYEGS